MDRAAVDEAAGGQAENTGGHRAWERVRDALLARIDDGDLKPGAMLPPKRELREQYRCSPRPAGDALADLERRGVIRRVPGTGYQVVAAGEAAADPREWVRAANAIVDLISSGEFRSGAFLPARPVLGDRIGAPAHTVKRATEELAAQGVIEFAAHRWRVCANFRYVPPVPPGRHAQDPGQPVQALAWAWQGVYQVSGSGSEMEAWRLDGSGSVRGGTLAELRDAIIADYPKYAAGTP